ncbi:MAG: helix-turn-helix domain-containing protein [Kineosporiaceae bacterium]|jgi:transcriptional regulator with XRE-family HTH domain
MDVWPNVVLRARCYARLSQLELARRAGTSRPTLSAYEHGRKAPTADTLERLLAAAGFRIAAVPVVPWREVPLGRGRSCWVPDRLWRLPVAEAFAAVVLPLELNWSTPGRRFVTRDRRQRARLYEVLLREGAPEDLERWVDGGLLVDVWDDLVLPRAVRDAWRPTMDAELGFRGSSHLT